MRYSQMIVLALTCFLTACGGQNSEVKKQDLQAENLPWEKVAVAGDSSVTERMIVPGGWMVRTTMYGRLALTFVGDPTHSWMLPRRP